MPTLCYLLPVLYTLAYIIPSSSACSLLQKCTGQHVVHIVLFIVHWIFHKSDLSFDAVVKFYATGFIIATPTAFKPLVLKQQADTLRAEADALRMQLDESKKEAERLRLARVDNLIESILVNFTIDDDNQLLNTEEQVAKLMVCRLV